MRIMLSFVLSLAFSLAANADVLSAQQGILFKTQSSDSGCRPGMVEVQLSADKYAVIDTIYGNKTSADRSNIAVRNGCVDGSFCVGNNVINKADLGGMILGIFPNNSVCVYFNGSSAEDSGHIVVLETKDLRLVKK